MIQKTPSSAVILFHQRIIQMFLHEFAEMKATHIVSIYHAFEISCVSDPMFTVFSVCCLLASFGREISQIISSNYNVRHISRHTLKYEGYKIIIKLV